MDHNYYNRKLTPYLDGSLEPQESSEFEAFLSTHPEFQEQIYKKQLEIDKLKELMPVPTLSQETLETLGHELKSSAFNLLKEEPKSVTERFKLSLEEWLSR